MDAISNTTQISRNIASDATGMRLRGVPGEMALQLLNRIIAGMGVEFPRDIVRVIMMIYRRMNPPLVACSRGMAVVVTDDRFWWKDLCMNRAQYAPVNLRINMVACGHQFAIAATDRGLYSWGSNAEGCLGRGNLSSIYVASPLYVALGWPIIAIACGESHVMMIIEIGSERVQGSGCIQSSGCIQRRLYGWGRIIGLGLKYETPRMILEADHYDIPMQIDIVDPAAVVCRADYSLVLAKGCVWICHDGGLGTGYIQNSRPLNDDGGLGDATHPGSTVASYNSRHVENSTCGLGPRKLEFSNVTKMIACCAEYMIWSSRAAMRGYVHGHDGRGDIGRHDDAGLCNIADRYIGSGRGIVRSQLGWEAFTAICWPPAGCWAETYLFHVDMSQFDEIISITGEYSTLVIVTSSAVYLAELQKPVVLIGKW